MAKRVRRRKSRLDKAAATIGRALGKALNRVHKIDSDVRKVMDARGRNLQQLGRDAGRKIAYLGRSGSKVTKGRGKSAKAALRTKKRPVSRAGSSRRVAARRAPRRRTKSG
ncbi:MAG TPA: hypothetical protein VES67_06020 [Vicinamibacterales bacterium]|nr:hypothetical protein [Vicinamibacterales bacterium]